jgi:hypothetical protein
MLLIGGSRDEIAPLDIHHTPLISAFQQTSTTRVQSVILPSDHAFSDARIAVAKHILSWLDELKQKCA